MRYRAARTRCSWRVVFDAQWGYKMRARAGRLYVRRKVKVRWSEVNVKEDLDGRSACSPVPVQSSV